MMKIHVVDEQKAIRHDHPIPGEVNVLIMEYKMTEPSENCRSKNENKDDPTNAGLSGATQPKEGQNRYPINGQCCMLEGGV
jgi:hypothetical protein